MAKDPDNELFLEYKANLLEMIKLSSDIEEDEKKSSELKDCNKTVIDNHKKDPPTKQAAGSSRQPSVDNNNPARKQTPTEADILARKRELNRKKKAKLREKIREQSEIAETEKQSWQSFANRKGLKGITKRSIFASPYSVTGKVGVGTNGIADAPSAASTIASGKHNKH